MSAGEKEEKEERNKLSRGLCVRAEDERIGCEPNIKNQGIEIYDPLEGLTTYKEQLTNTDYLQSLKQKRRYKRERENADLKEQEIEEINKEKDGNKELNNSERKNSSSSSFSGKQSSKSDLSHKNSKNSEYKEYNEGERNSNSDIDRNKSLKSREDSDSLAESQSEVHSHKNQKTNKSEVEQIKDHKEKDYSEYHENEEEFEEEERIEESLPVQKDEKSKEIANEGKGNEIIAENKEDEIVENKEKGFLIEDEKDLTKEEADKVKKDQKSAALFIQQRFKMKKKLGQIGAAKKAENNSDPKNKEKAKDEPKSENVESEKPKSENVENEKKENEDLKKKDAPTKEKVVEDDEYADNEFEAEDYIKGEETINPEKAKEEEKGFLIEDEKDLTKEEAQKVRNDQKNAALFIQQRFKMKKKLGHIGNKTNENTAQKNEGKKEEKEENIANEKIQEKANIQRKTDNEESNKVITKEASENKPVENTEKEEGFLIEDEKDLTKEEATKVKEDQKSAALFIQQRFKMKKKLGQIGKKQPVEPAVQPKNIEKPKTPKDPDPEPQKVAKKEEPEDKNKIVEEKSKTEKNPMDSDKNQNRDKNEENMIKENGEKEYSAEGFEEEKDFENKENSSEAKVEKKVRPKAPSASKHKIEDNYSDEEFPSWINEDNESAESFPQNKQNKTNDQIDNNEELDPERHRQNSLKARHDASKNEERTSEKGKEGHEGSGSSGKKAPRKQQATRKANVKGKKISPIKKRGAVPHYMQETNAYKQNKMATNPTYTNYDDQYTENYNIQQIGCVKTFALRSPGALFADGKYGEDALSYMRNTNPNPEFMNQYMEEDSNVHPNQRQGFKNLTNPHQSMPNLRQPELSDRFGKFPKKMMPDIKLVSPYSSMWNLKILEDFYDIKCTELDKKDHGTPMFKIRKIPKVNTKYPIKVDDSRKSNEDMGNGNQFNRNSHTPTIKGFGMNQAGKRGVRTAKGVSRPGIEVKRHIMTAKDLRRQPQSAQSMRTSSSYSKGVKFRPVNSMTHSQERLPKSYDPTPKYATRLGMLHGGGNYINNNINININHNYAIAPDYKTSPPSASPNQKQPKLPQIRTNNKRKL